ncbi:DJ-1/PfpI family protein [Pelagerythrobacter aerophilus]|uniref:Transcriptional regulator n=1 Tax=Pelagerythrobacter aerophilus TaxID=2306995 RepID=A0A418NK68_9SPHN|nr:DJ-1/PfpI family protein [Pelagerythrobacter aerophilus]RIV79690.1 transcriptional regulator [Pelagerythrobacter aerophilus]
MSKSIFIWGGVAVVLLCLGGFAGWIFSLPSKTVAVEAPPVPQEEAAAMLAALRHDGEGRPVIAVVGVNDATETNDYITTTGILRRADVADVIMLATGPGPVQLYPALRAEPDATIAKFDAGHPEGADYVIVPAMSRDDDPAVLAWLRDQSRKGARILGVCAGAKVVGAAGLLDGKRATTHWYYRREMLERSPTIEYVAGRRMVADGNVVTTTGITAAMPMMLTLIEAIAGHRKAEEVAHELGVEAWDARHSSAAFRLTRPFVTTVLANRMTFWNRDTWGIELQPGMDEVSLAIVADAWSRTYRSDVVTFAASTHAVATANGIRILPDLADDQWPSDRRVSIFPAQRPVDALDRTLDTITDRYGKLTTDVVAMQLEYPRTN